MGNGQSKQQRDNSVSVPPQQRRPQQQWAYQQDLTTSQQRANDTHQTPKWAIYPNAPVPPDFDNQDERVRVAVLRQGAGWDQLREEAYWMDKRRTRDAIMQARRFDSEARYNQSPETPNLQSTAIHPNAPVPQDFDNPDDRVRVAVLRKGAGWDQLREEAYWMDKRRTRDAINEARRFNQQARRGAGSSGFGN